MLGRIRLDGLNDVERLTGESARTYDDDLSARHERLRRQGAGTFEETTLTPALCASMLPISSAVEVSAVIKPVAATSRVVKRSKLVYAHFRAKGELGASLRGVKDPVQSSAATAIDIVMKYNRCRNSHTGGPGTGSAPHRVEGLERLTGHAWSRLVATKVRPTEASLSQILASLIVLSVTGVHFQLAA